MLQSKEEKSMKQRWSRLVLILSGMIVTLLIAASLVICIFFPELLPSGTGNHDEAKTEFFAMDTYITLTVYGRNAEATLSNAEDKHSKMKTHVIESKE